MAKPSWLTITPMQGSGNQVVNNAATEHTGRLVREGTITVTANGVASPVTYKVVQEALPEYVQWNNGTEMAVSLEGGTVVIAGNSNSSKLSFDWVIPEGSTEPEVDFEGNTSTSGVNYPTIAIPNNYLVGGATATNNTAITGDPGAITAYNFSIQLEFPLNDAVVDVYRTLQVKANGAQVAQIVIKQTAGHARIELSSYEITIPQDGSQVSINVISNTDWTIA